MVFKRSKGGHLFWLVKLTYRYAFIKLLKKAYFLAYPTNAALLDNLKQEQYTSEKITYRKFQGTKRGLTDNIRQFNYKNHEEYLEFIRFRNIEGAILHSPATSISFFLSIISLIIPFFILPAHSFADFSFLMSKKIWAGCILSLLSFLVLIPYLRHYVLKLPLNDYAIFIKNVYSESEMLSFISYRIWSVCNKYKTSTEWLNELYDHHSGGKRKLKKFLITKEEIKLKKDNRSTNWKFPDIRMNETYGTSVPYGVDRLFKIRNNFGKHEGNRFQLHSGVEKDLKYLNYTIIEIEKDLQKIMVLIRYCSERLRIPQIELVEHFFQFSPSMYWSWVKKTSHNLDVVTDLFEHAELRNDNSVISPSSHFLHDQIRALLFQTNRFIERNESFMQYQSQNIAFNDLHDDIIDMASSASSSEPIKIYIRLLSRIAGEFDPNKDFKDITETTMLERLIYIYHKRKIHVGLDLHHSAYNIMKSIVQENKAQRGMYHDYDIINDLFKQDQNKFDRLLKVAKNKPGSSYSTVANLKAFHSSAVKYIDICRFNLEKEFSKKLENIFKVWIDEIEARNEDRGLKCDQNILLITFGYSKAIRQIIKNCIVNNRIEKYTKIVVFSSEEESTIDARQIKYHLTEQPGKKAEHVLVSHPEFIVPIIGEDTRILVLMGAEAFDMEGNTVRTHSHKKCLKDFLKGAICKIGNSNSISSNVNLDCIGKQKVIPEALRDKIKIYVCAESYKKHDKLFELTNLFDDQYEKIEIYDSSLIDEVICN